MRNRNDVQKYCTVFVNIGKQFYLKKECCSRNGAAVSFLPYFDFAGCEKLKTSPKERKMLISD